MFKSCSLFSVSLKGAFLVFVFLCVHSLSAQKLVDYLDIAVNKFRAEPRVDLLSRNYSSTQLEFGYFIDPQYTISGAQNAYVSFMQEIPWIGKSGVYKKVQRYDSLKDFYLIEQEKELLKFKIKELYYKLYGFEREKNSYANLADKLRSHIKLLEKDTTITSTKVILKLFERKQQLIEITEKLQLVDGDYQNSVLQFNSLLRRDGFQEVELPFDLAMPDEEQAISFSDAYENPLFIAYENQLEAIRLKQRYNNKWLPTLSLGVKYVQVDKGDNLLTQLPVRDIVEPRLKLGWDLFSNSKKRILKNEIEDQVEQKIFDITSLLQMVVNEQISARISYFSATDKLGQLIKLKKQLLENNVSLSSDELFQIEYLEFMHEISKVKAVTEYYVSSSKMLLYQ